MDFEKITHNELKIFFSNEDLHQLGLLSIESLWQDPYMWNELMEEMKTVVAEQLGIELMGTIFVEIHSKENVGIVFYLTIDDQSEEYFFDDEFLMCLPLEKGEYLFQFADIEYVIELAKRLAKDKLNGGKLYFYQEKYYLILEKNHLSTRLIPLLLEYGEYSSITIPYLLEYGSPIFKQDALIEINQYFSCHTDH